MNFDNKVEKQLIDDVVIVIPAYNPDEKFDSFLNDLKLGGV